MYPWKPCSQRPGPPDATFPDTHLTACDLHCSEATAAWRAMLIMLHGVTSGPSTSRGLEIWCPVYGHAAQRGWWYTLQYCSQDNSRASTDHGSLTRYVRRAELLTARSKHFTPHDLRLWLRWPSSANYPAERHSCVPDVAVSSNHSEGVNSVKCEQT